MKRVIDISKHNTIVDWNNVAKDVEGIIVRCGYRGYTSGRIATDEKYRENIKQILSHKIPFSLYFFPCSINEKEAIEESEFIIMEVKALRAKGVDISFPVYLDSEISDVKNKSGRSDKLDRKTRTKLLKVILDNLTRNGIKGGVYASTSWLNNNLIMSDLGDIPVWVAQYGPKVTYNGRYDAWQFTSNAIIKGINGKCDLSRYYDEPENYVKEPAATEPSIKKAAYVVATTNGGGLRVRSAPTTDSDIVKVIPNGGKVMVLDTTIKDWYKTEDGYMSSKYLKKL